mgnify:CR=1 FL=1
MIKLAEMFLLNCLSKSRDDYRYEQYHDSKTVDFMKLVCTSLAIEEHIKRVYYQSMQWYTAPEPPIAYPGPTDNHGYKLTHDTRILPIIVKGDARPSDLPPP